MNFSERLDQKLEEQLELEADTKYKGQVYRTGATINTDPGDEWDPKTQTVRQGGNVGIRNLYGPAGHAGTTTPRGDIISLTGPGEEEKEEKKKKNYMPKASGFEIVWRDPYTKSIQGQTIPFDDLSDAVTCPFCKGSAQLPATSPAEKPMRCHTCYGTGLQSDRVDRIRTVLSRSNTDVKVRPARGKKPKYMTMGGSPLP